MPTSSSSSSTIHHSYQFNRKPKNTSGPILQEQAGNYSVPNNMKPQEQRKKMSNGSLVKKEKGVKYKECRKNHAANIGGYAVDGCREFMASGEEGTSAALKCAACNCHRNFHKREVEDEEEFCDCSSNSTTRK